MRQEARLSMAVPQSTAFLPPAFMAMLPPTHEASAEVGSTANTKPAASAASETLRVTTPAPAKMVATGASRPSRVRHSTGPRSSSFSVLMTTDRGVSGMAPPVYPVPPPRGMIVRPNSMQAFTRGAISASVSGASTTNGYSTRQSVASVTCETLERPSKRMLSAAVCLEKRLAARRRRLAVSSKDVENRVTAARARASSPWTLRSRCSACGSVSSRGRR